MFVWPRPGVSPYASGSAGGSAGLPTGQTQMVPYEGDAEDDDEPETSSSDKFGSMVVKICIE